MLIAFYSDTPGCGKTSAAEYLWTEHNFVRLSFASIVTSMIEPLLDAFDYDIDEIDTPELKNAPLMRLPSTPSLRLLKQTLGTEWGRKIIDKDIWVQAMLYRINKINEMYSGINIVIDDMRFPNEYAALEGLPDARLVKLHRDVDFKASIEVIKHSSNGALAGYDFPYNITNNGTLKDLYTEIDQLLLTPP
jgi:hypothetical protein